MATIHEKLLHLANLENSYIALMKAGSNDSTIQVGYRDEYQGLSLDDLYYYDDHYKTISLCLQQILLNLEVEDIEEDQQQKQELKDWIERYPLSLGIINWDGYDENDEDHHASEQFPFLLREIIRKKKFRLLPFLIEAGINYFEDGLRGGLLQKLSCFNDIYRGYSYTDDDDEAHEFFPHDFVYPGMTVLDAIVSFNYDDSIAVELLSTLRDMGILQRNQVQDQSLLVKTFYFGGNRLEKMFNFLVEMNPEALLKEVDEGDKDAFDILLSADDRFYNNGFYDNWKDWTPALIVIFSTCGSHRFKVALQTTLKIFPTDLGLLLLQAKDNSSYPSWKDRAVLLSYFNEDVGIDRGWEVIESSFRNMTNRHALFSLDQEKAIYPFMPVAESLAHCCDDADIKLTLLYYLLREDLSWTDAL